MKIAQLATLAALAALAAEASAFAPGPALTSRAPATRRSACKVQMSRGQSNERNSEHNSVGKVGRRAVLALAALPALGLRRASAASAPSEAAEMARLQAEAARIQEIFDVQKELNSALPSLKDGLKATKAGDTSQQQTRVARAADSVSGPVDMQNVVAVIDTMMAALKAEGENGMKTVLAFSAPSNPIKNMPLQNVINSMQDGKYGLLFGKFTSYEIKQPEQVPVDPDEFAHSSVDVIVKAPFDVMIKNGMQFEDFQETRDTGVKLVSAAKPGQKLCAATFRWVMRQEQDGKWTNEGCYVVPVQSL